MRGKRLLALVGAVVLALAIAAATAVAGHITDDVKSLTGCLTAGGELTKIKEGNAPVSPCARGQVLAHVSGGDITSVEAGSGLSAEGTNGAVEFSIDAGFSLPQNCATFQVPKADPDAGTWVCGNDNDRTGSDARQKRVDDVTLNGGTLTTVAQLAVPAGSYLVTVSGSASSGADDELAVACGIYPSPSSTSPVAVVNVKSEVGFLDVGAQGSIAMSGIVFTLVATTIELKCRSAEGHQAFAVDINLISTNLTSVTNQ